jgi:hypothetical protein
MSYRGSLSCRVVRYTKESRLSPNNNCYSPPRSATLGSQKRKMKSPYSAAVEYHNIHLSAVATLGSPMHPRLVA